MVKRILLLVVLYSLLPFTVRAAEMQRVEVSREGELYSVVMDVLIDAVPGDVWEVMSDFRNLARFSPNIVESRSLSVSSEKGRQRIKVVMRPCLLIFCKELVKVSDVEQASVHSIRYTAVAGESDFVYGLETLEFVDRSPRTLLRYRAALEPAFKVPKLLGKPLLKYFLSSDLLETSNYIEEYCFKGNTK